MEIFVSNETFLISDWGENFILKPVGQLVALGTCLLPYADRPKVWFNLIQFRMEDGSQGRKTPEQQSQVSRPVPNNATVSAMMTGDAPTPVTRPGGTRSFTPTSNRQIPAPVHTFTTTNEALAFSAPLQKTYKKVVKELELKFKNDTKTFQKLAAPNTTLAVKSVQQETALEKKVKF